MKPTLIILLCATVLLWGCGIDESDRDAHITCVALWYSWWYATMVGSDWWVYIQWRAWYYKRNCFNVVFTNKL